MLLSYGEEEFIELEFTGARVFKLCYVRLLVWNKFGTYTMYFKNTMGIKMLRIIKKKICYTGMVITILVILLHPIKNARWTYDYIPKEVILDNLHEGLAINFTSTSLVNCEYQDTINDETMLPASLMKVEGDLIDGYRIWEGGEYAPECKPKFSTAVIVPYRDRAEQLRGFLVYMHNFLRRQRIHYRIYVVEQVDSKPFNRAKLLNVGAAAAMRAGYPCLVLHDVDLLPLKPANLYACTKIPRHMSSCINKFRFVLPYLELFGGVIAIISEQFKAVNGMSNEYFGWGGEDDDLYSRLQAQHLSICRFEPMSSLYYMTKHKGQQKGVSSKMWNSAKKSIASDGLNSLRFTEVVTVKHPLFTHIVVDL